MTEEINIGDTVILKSTISPSMTVGSMHPNKSDMVICYWFDDKNMKRGSFPTSSLKRLQNGR